MGDYKALLCRNILHLVWYKSEGKMSLLMTFGWRKITTSMVSTCKLMRGRKRQGVIWWRQQKETDETKHSYMRKVRWNKVSQSLPGLEQSSSNCSLCHSWTGHTLILHSRAMAIYSKQKSDRYTFPQVPQPCPLSHPLDEAQACYSKVCLPYKLTFCYAASPRWNLLLFFLFFWELLPLHTPTVTLQVLVFTSGHSW